jgi:hypothetical protein
MEKHYQTAKDLYMKNQIADIEKIKFDEVKEENTSKVYVPYPSTKDDNFNNMIASKKEFARHKYRKEIKGYDEVVSEKCSKSRFSLSSNQKFLKTFMSLGTPYNSILIYHEVGLGKTCAAISIAEQFMSHYKKKALVIVSPNLKENFRRQIFDITKVKFINEKVFDERNNERMNQCTGSTYLKMIPDRKNETPEGLDNRVMKLINERYQFRGPMEFANDYKRIEDQYGLRSPSKYDDKTLRIKQYLFDQKLSEIYSDRVIIIDEVHNLRTAKEDTKKRVPPILERVLRVAKNVKLVLLTATPMFNEASEIVGLLNYMLLNDKQPPLKLSEVFEKNKLTQKGKELLIKASRGRISYMRGENPYTFPIKFLPSVNKDKHILKDNEKPTIDISGNKITQKNHLEKLEIIKSYMSPYQKRIYEKIKLTAFSNTNTPKSQDMQEDVPKDIQMATQVSNIVFPSRDMARDIHEYYGSEGFKRCFTTGDGKLFRVAYNETIVQNFGEFLQYDKIETYAPKLRRILDYVLKSDGIVYIFSSYITSGIIPLAIALEHCGFRKYNGNNIATDISVSNDAKGNPKYIILSGDPTLSPDNTNEIKQIKSSKNMNGEIIKVVLCTNVATEGIDFKGIREIHIMEPWYHHNKNEQITGRAVRNCSHTDLPIEKRNVTVYKHANLLPKSNQESIDLHVFSIAESKQENIEKVKDILKKNAVDCLLNWKGLYYDRANINKKIDIVTSQGSVIKNYELGDDPNLRANSKCFDNAGKEPTDNSTFTLSFFNDEIDYYLGYMIPFFMQKHYYTYQEIKKELGKYLDNIDEEVLMTALQDLIESKHTIYDKNNVPGYIVYLSNKYIFQERDNTDLRRTLEEREGQTQKTLKKKLDVRLMMKKQGSEIIDVQKIYQKISECAETKCKRFDNKQIFYQSCIDYVVDRLNEMELREIIRDLQKHIQRQTYLQKYIINSLMNAGIFIDTENVGSGIKYFVDYYTTPTSYYIYHDGVFKSMSDFEKTEMKEKVENLRQKVIGMFTNEDQLNGFISPESINNRFKLKKKKEGEGKKPKASSPGTVCYDDAKTLVGEMKEKIKAVLTENYEKVAKQKLPDKLLLSAISGTKGTLCDTLEIVTRALIPKQIARPYQYILLRTEKK